MDEDGDGLKAKYGNNNMYIIQSASRDLHIIWPFAGYGPRWEINMS